MPPGRSLAARAHHTAPAIPGQGGAGTANVDLNASSVTPSQLHRTDRRRRWRAALCRWPALVRWAAHKARGRRMQQGAAHSVACYGRCQRSGGSRWVAAHTPEGATPRGLCRHPRPRPCRAGSCPAADPALQVHMRRRREPRVRAASRRACAPHWGCSTHACSRPTAARQSTRLAAATRRCPAWPVEYSAAPQCPRPTWTGGGHDGLLLGCQGLLVRLLPPLPHLLALDLTLLLQGEGAGGGGASAAPWEAWK